MAASGGVFADELKERATMAITTRIAPMYGGQKIFAAVLCAVFGIWGAYDYAVKIPRQEAEYAEYEKLTEQLKGMSGRQLNEQEGAVAIAAATRLKEISPDGAAPVKPSKFNSITQWFYIACLPFAPWFLWIYVKTSRQKYTLDDDGTLHYFGDKEHGSGEWKQNEIADIDMGRWMAKSIAYAVHTDGRRLILDAYLHKNLHLIIGAIASRMYPDKWDVEAKIVKAGQGAEEGAEGAEPAEAVSE